MLALLKQTYQKFSDDNAQWLAAALAYFAIFSIAPLLIVLIEIAGLLIGNQGNVRNEIYAYISSNVGGSVGKAIRGIVDAALSQRRQGIIAEIVGWVAFLLGAVGLFASLQQALNLIWKVTVKRQGLWMTICREWDSFLVLLGVAGLLLVSLVVNTALTAAAGWLAHVSPFFPTLMKVLDFAVSFGVVWFALAFLFRYLPDVTVEWGDVLHGAALTALLMVAGQFMLGWYLGRAGTSSVYGAAGSLVIILIWAFYSCQILLFGAEFTYVYACKRGSKIGTDPLEPAKPTH